MCDFANACFPGGVCKDIGPVGDGQHECTCAGGVSCRTREGKSEKGIKQALQHICNNVSLKQWMCETI